MKTHLRPPKTILFPVDFSPHDAAAAGYVRLLASEFGSKVVLLHVLEPISHPFEMFSGGMIETRSRTEVMVGRLNDFGAQELAGLDVQARAAEGEPAQTIDRVTGEIDADLICMPSRGHGPFRHFLLGSVTAKVLNDVKVPVLTGAHLERPADRQSPLRIANVVCALSFDERGERALDAAKLLSAAYKAKLTIVHVLEGHASSVDAERKVRDLAPDISASVVIETGEPAKKVSRVASETKADVVVIGRSTPGPLGRLTNHSYAIIRESPAPVLSV
jgi:nucleotide-binding universal stress UspA family protein